MLRAKRSELRDSSRIALRYVFRGSPSRRTIWWTQSPLESHPTKIPPASTLSYPDDLDLNDISRLLLDLSSDTLLGNALQLDAVDLSIKNIPETQSKRDEACEFLRCLLSTGPNNEDRKTEPSPVPTNQELRCERQSFDFQGASSSRFEDPSTDALQTLSFPFNAPPQTEEQSSHPLSLNPNDSSLINEAMQKSRTLSLPSPRESSPFTPKHSRPLANPKGFVEHVAMEERLSEIRMLWEKAVEPPVVQQNDINSPVEPPSVDQSFINPRFIKPPPKKRKSTNVPNYQTMLHMDHNQASRNSIPSSESFSASEVKSVYTQTSANGEPSASASETSSNPYSAQLSNSNTDGSGFLHNTLKELPSAAAQLQSYPSSSTSFDMVAKQYFLHIQSLLASTIYGGPHGSENKNLDPSGQQTLNGNHSQLNSATPFTPSTASGDHGHQIVSTNTNHSKLAYGTETSNSVDSEIDETPLYIRWLHQQFASVIQNAQPAQSSQGLSTQNRGKCRSKRGPSKQSRGKSIRNREVSRPNSLIPEPHPSAPGVNPGSSGINPQTSGVNSSLSGPNLGTTGLLPPSSAILAANTRTCETTDFSCGSSMATPGFYPLDPKCGITEPSPGNSAINPEFSGPKTDGPSPGTVEPNQLMGSLPGIRNQTKNVRRKSNPKKTKNPKSSSGVDWAKASSSYQHAVYNSFDEYNSDFSQQEGLLPWNLLFPKRSYKRRAKKVDNQTVGNVQQ